MPFAPTDISDLFVWIRADTGAYQDAGLAVPCTDGTTVYTWENFGSDPSNFVQSNASLRPTYTAASFWGGDTPLPAILFSSKYLDSTTATIASGTPITVFCVARLTNPGVTGVMISANGAASFQIANNPGGPGYLYRGGGPASTFGAWNTSRPMILSAILDGNSPYCFAWRDRNDTAVPNGVFNGSNTIPFITIGSAAGLTYPFNGEYYEILIYTKKLSDAERIQVRTYLEDRFHPYISSSVLAESTIQSPTWLPANRPLTGFSLGGAERYQHGIRKETVDGDASPPSLALDLPGFWRFRWGVKAGARTISINTKQTSGDLSCLPKMVVEANPAIGVPVDISTDAAAAVGWTSIGPVAINPTSDGVLWVQLWNMDCGDLPVPTPTFFDDIVTS